MLGKTDRLQSTHMACNIPFCAGKSRHQLGSFKNMVSDHYQRYQTKGVEFAEILDSCHPL